MKKKNPTDATLRNVKAANKRITSLEKSIKQLAAFSEGLAKMMHSLLGKLAEYGVFEKGKK